MVISSGGESYAMYIMHLAREHIGSNYEEGRKELEGRYLEYILLYP